MTTHSVKLLTPQHTHTLHAEFPRDVVLLCNGQRMRTAHVLGKFLLVVHFPREKGSRKAALNDGDSTPWKVPPGPDTPGH